MCGPTGIHVDNRNINTNTPSSSSLFSFSRQNNINTMPYTEQFDWEELFDNMAEYRVLRWAMVVCGYLCDKYYEYTLRLMLWRLGDRDDENNNVEEEEEKKTEEEWAKWVKDAAAGLPR